MEAAMELAGLHIRPLKGAGELRGPEGAPIREWRTGRHGLVHDHILAVVREDTGAIVGQSLFPQMARIEPVYCLGEGFLFRVPGEEDGIWANVDQIEGEHRRVVIHDDIVDSIDLGQPAADILTRFLGMRVRGVRIAPDSQRRSPWGGRLAFHDASQVHLTTQSSMDDLRSRLPVQVDHTIFRSQLHLRGGLPPFAEDSVRAWQVGDTQLLLVGLCGRCPVPDVDPATGTRRPGAPVTKALFSYRVGLDPASGKTKAYFGVRLDFVRTPIGTVLRVGDPAVPLKTGRQPQLGSMGDISRPRRSDA